MGILYDPTAKKWNVVKEKTDNSTTQPTGTTLYKVTTTFYSGPIKGQVTSSQTTTYTEDPESERKKNSTYKSVVVDNTPIYMGLDTNINDFKYDQQLQNIYKEKQTDWKNNDSSNKNNEILNKQNTVKNSAYDTVLATANRTNGGDYATQRDSLNSISNALKNAGVPEQDATAFTSSLKDRYKTFYRTEKLQPWDSKLGAKPAYGTFDATYYKNNNSRAAQDWTNAVNNDDIDITERYGETNFYLQDYTTRGKPAGVRGNAAEATRAANKYLETTPTDADLQAVRDLQLGINTETQSDRLLRIPEIAKQWEAAKNNDPYWDKLAKEKYLDVSKPDEFAALFRLSNRPEDKQVSLNYNINAGMAFGVTQLEDALNQAVGEKAIVDVKKFGALAQNVLKDSIAEMTKAKQKEQTLSLFGGLSGFSEIMDINKTLTNSILGDSGVGEILSMMGTENSEEALTKSLQSVTGIQSNVIYNWQEWFDKTLKDKYNKDIDLGYTTNQAEENVKIDSEFARTFLDTYLTPRFNTARSMDEFVEYLDIRQEEQNPFQTQDLLNATKLTADLRSKQYLDQIKSTAARSFDPNFYFNPTGDKARETAYANQASTVANDWEAAKKGNAYWQQQAYRFGVDINDKAAFARMHFEVKGQGKGYDAAEDILNAGKVQDEIYTNILPALKDEVLKQGTVFGVFVTPEEFADQMLVGLDPADTKAWDEVLKLNGMDTFQGTVDELKQSITENLRSGTAQDIREQIKYLNEKKEKPTQEVLGLTYIERPEDAKDVKTTAETELYKTFKSAGYKGTEDEFYTRFFPDVDRSDLALVTKAASATGLQMEELDFSDPFASFNTVGSLLEDDTNTTTSTSTSTKKSTSSSGSKTDTSDFFSLGLKDDEDTDYKSTTGQSFLSGFTSMFK
jgi:hypothetical protein